MSDADCCIPASKIFIDTVDKIPASVMNAMSGMLPDADPQICRSANERLAASAGNTPASVGTSK
jgi:hypothetical protein